MDEYEEFVSDGYSSFEGAIWNPSSLDQSGVWQLNPDLYSVPSESEESSAVVERVVGQGDPDTAVSEEVVGGGGVAPGWSPARVAVNRNRLQSATFFLTYAQTGYDKERVASFLRTKGTIKRMIVANETHQDGGKHVHALVEFDRRKDVRPNFFDIGSEHPNIGIWTNQSQKFDAWFVNHWDYCCKEDLSPIMIGTRPSVERKRKRDDVFKQAREVAVTRSVEEAMLFLLEACPYEAVTKYQNISNALHVIRGKASQHSRPARQLSEFTNVPDIPADWKNLFLTGETGQGKTQFARALLPGATVVSHRNQLCLADFTKGVIFDDFDVSHWPPAAVIHLLDWDEPRGIDVKHGHVIIPPGTRKIFTYNRELWEWAPKECPSSQFDAIKRRITEVRVERRLYSRE